MDDDDRRYMRRALELAPAGRGRVHPNPLVGAVIVSGGRIVGEGWHAEFGGPHAEVIALERAGEAARGATMYVTLEPCAHHGKTPPCTEAIRAAGIRRIVYGAADPNRDAAGGGGCLAEWGLDVRGGVLAEEAVGVDPAFHWTHRNATPWVELKLAVSLDSRISRGEGRQTAVSGPESIARTHALRAGFDAILVGRRTVEVDDPLLTVRGAVTSRLPPVRVVFDSMARTSPKARFFGTIGDAQVLIVATDAAPAARVETLRDAGARVIQAPGSEQGVAVADALRLLRAEGIRSILCEGGGRLAVSLLKAEAIGRLHVFLAPSIFGESGVPAFPLAGSSGEWVFRAVEAVGRDALLVLDRATGVD